MSETSPSPAPGKREFAFSRVAGVSPTEYAAVSPTAVFALIVSLFSWMGLLWPWGLAAPAAALALALLAVYQIATSAETLTGRKVATAAIGVSLLVGGAGVIRQVVDYRQEQRDTAEVRALAQQLCDQVLARNIDGMYQQLSEQVRSAMPPSYWRYEWTRFFEGRGPARKAELAPWTRVSLTGLMVVSMKIYIDDPQASAEEGRPVLTAIPVRLVYGRPPDQPAAAPPEQGPPGQPQPRGQPLATVSGSSGPWQLTDLPSFMSPLPPPYIEPLVWPAPGKVQRIFADGSAPQIVVPTPGLDHLPTTAPDNRPIQTELALPPLVPPMMSGGRWLPLPPSGGR